MKYRIIYSPRSERDVKRIWRWIADESESPEIATRFVGRLFDACKSLKIFPQRFAIYPYARNWRMMPFRNYLIFFQIHEEEVRIGHVRHCARRPFSANQ